MEQDILIQGQNLRTLNISKAQFSGSRIPQLKKKAMCGLQIWYWCTTAANKFTDFIAPPISSSIGTTIALVRQNIEGFPLSSLKCTRTGCKSHRAQLELKLVKCVLLPTDRLVTIWCVERFLLSVYLDSWRCWNPVGFGRIKPSWINLWTFLQWWEKWWTGDRSSLLSEDVSLVR